MYKPFQYVILVLILLAMTITAALGQGTPAATAPADQTTQKSDTAAPASQTAPKSDTAAPATTPAPAPAPATAPAAPERGPFETSQPAISAPAAPTTPVDPDKLEVSIDFVKADLANVLAFLSMASGVPIVVDADVKGTVTITSLRKVTLTMAYDVINSSLRVRGYTMVGTLKDKMIRVMPLKKAVADRPSVRIGSKLSEIGDSDTVITQVIPLNNISAAKLKDELKPLVPDDQANLLAVSSTNTLIVTDTEANVRRLVEIVNLLDTDTTDVLDMEVYQCKYASATVLITSLEKVLGINSQQSGQNGQQGRGGPPQQNPGGQPGNIQTDSGVLSLKGELRLSADERTNSIIISASKPKIDMVLNLVKKLDVNTTPEVKSQVFRLQYADATMVSTQLNSMFEQPQGGSNRSPFFFFGGQQQTTSTSYAGLKRNMVVADVRTNSVVVTATDQNLQVFASMIKDLDTPNVLSDIARTYQLKYAKASTTATIMNNLFRGTNQRQSFLDIISGNSSTQNGDPIAQLRKITVVADDKTNTLLITGPPQLLAGPPPQQINGQPQQNNAQPSALSMIDNIIANLDRRAVQVFIEVAIVDVTLDNNTKFGIEWNWKNGSTSTAANNGASTNFGLNGIDLGMKYSVISDNLQALLQSLKTRSDVKVYSTPSITTADNVAASISIGQDVPFVSADETTTGGGVRRTVDFKNVSITLNVTPHVTAASDLIGLDVSQTINELIGRDVELNSPIIANRSAKTTVMVNDRQTIVIGGIIKENNTKETTQVPLLAGLPLVGELFKSHNNTKQKSELMVFLTPHILRVEQDINDVTDKQQHKLSEPVTIIDNLKK